MRANYLVFFNDPGEIVYMTGVSHQHDDTGDWSLDGPEVRVSSSMASALLMPYDIATYFAALFDGEVIEN